MTLKARIDLNADVGEGFGAYQIGLDEQVIPLISSANIACGFHAGDPSIMRRTISLAKQHGVAVGAHPGLPDLMGFGRRRIEVTYQEVKDYAAYQIGAIMAICLTQGLTLQHVKPHGALYNMAETDPKLWEAFLEVMAPLGRDLVLYAAAGPHSRELRALGRQYGPRVALEFFADRAYNPDGTLVSRRQPGAVIHDPELAAARVVKMATQGLVECLDGRMIEVAADTVCVHGDNPAAVVMAGRVRTALAEAGIEVAPAGSFLL